MFEINTRVRTLIDLVSAEWAPEQPDIPAADIDAVRAKWERWGTVPMPKIEGLRFCASLTRKPIPREQP